MMKIGWFDGGAGASGDMTLGALYGARADITFMQGQIDLLDLGIVLRAEPVQRAGIAAVKMHVDVPVAKTLRHLPEILTLFEALDTKVGEMASEVFQRLAQAEAAVHDMPVDKVHFHEVGALDSIADVVGSMAGFCSLDLDQIHCSPLSLGSGSTRGSHGPIPVPVPAVLQLLKGVAPAQAGPAPYESTTPTGAAIMTTVVDTWGPMPEMLIDDVGRGAGTKDSDHVANVLRLVTGTTEPS